MLALYDADANALQRKSSDLGRTELYGRLLKEFAQREVLKHAGALPDSDPERAVETELLRLSVIAFAMFSRSSQWVSGTDLDADLSALPGTSSYGHRQVCFRAPLSAAQLAVGRSFSSTSQRRPATAADCRPMNSFTPRSGSSWSPGSLS
jgi:hypothetical protein